MARHSVENARSSRGGLVGWHPAHGVRMTTSSASASSTRWWLRFRELDELCAKLDRFPSHADFLTSSDDHSAGLEAWVWRQRKAQLTDKQMNALASLPGYDWAPRETQWDRALARYERFVELNGVRPRFGSGDREERALADWYARQWRLLGRGKLAYRRVVSLRSEAVRQSTGGRGQ